MANPLSNPAGNVAPRWVYQAILVEMTDKTLYGLRATQRHKEIRGIFNGGIWPNVSLALTVPPSSPSVLFPNGNLCIGKTIFYIETTPEQSYKTLNLVANIAVFTKHTVSLAPTVPPSSPTGTNISTSQRQYMSGLKVSPAWVVNRVGLVPFTIW